MDRREAITASNQGPVVSVLTWIIQATVAAALAIKFTLSSIIPGKRNREDIPLSLAAAFGVGFTIAISLAVPRGIGRHEATLSQGDLESLQKALYASNILFVLVSASAQASVLFLFHELTPDRTYKRAIAFLAVFIALFATAALLVAIFPCRPPRVWEILADRGCGVNQVVFWQAFAGVNIAVEMALVLFPVFVVLPLKMKTGRKAILISCFAARLVVIASFAVQIYEVQTLKPSTTTPRDRTFPYWRFTLATVVVQGLSIITVCIPYIRNLLLSIESGMIQTGHIRLGSASAENSHMVSNASSNNNEDAAQKMMGRQDRGRGY
ncbi:hypothetical protein F5Y17DRAFT_464631 [Xylariaceae sp. FL0594]|nr:hypothetical protein F5Y17DRAFT_464631 [Xylariaceae sp. FL0594]